MKERIPLEFYCWELTSRCQLLHPSDDSTFKPFPSQKVLREGNSFSWKFTQPFSSRSVNMFSHV